MAKHALMSPSSAERWMCCPGSVPLTQNLPDESSPFAAEGSCAHEVAARCLEENQSASIFIGRRFHDIVVTAEMAEHVDAYTQAVRDYRQHPSDELLIEVALPIEVITGEADARGTADAVVLSFGKQEVSVIDLKYGRGVRVQAEQNLQLIIYALAVLALYGVIADWQTVRLVIVQPRAGGVSEWVIAVGELEAYANQLRLAAERVRQALSDGPTHFLNPGEKACRWCRAKAICPALSAQVLKDVESIPETTPTTEIAHLLPRLGLIEDWCRALRAEAERRLIAGISVPGFKLVEGKKGPRAWDDPTQVESLLKSMRLKAAEMYDQ
ncbi:MAG TPA: DUF2800 domain-containing protein [Accumulibacter sp.]|uniref:DUF2800 domain-containing protein n=1 Tax=Accumulibacter sp. TaxID=2053492 RepID=UPI002BC6DB3F|nr:DUF2800 domain-containing protein [Accumulibacter sp.]HRD88227.1 DUF2800 domain-containing protein [Accumulibacter sp.]